MSNPTTRRPFLLEIGSEEIPARFISTAMAEIESRLTALLAAEHLTHTAWRVLATPRRLVILADGVDTCQPDRDDELKGPPVTVAFDADGKPTRAGEGFARKAGVDLADCLRGQDKRGEYLLVKRTVRGRDAADVLAEAIPALVLGLPFRKTMRWGSLDIEYARPLQWLVCLLGEDVVEFSVGDLRSGRTTRGHRTLMADRTREIPSAGDYDAIMAELAVIPDPAQRRRLIVEQADALLTGRDDPTVLRDDPELLDEVVNLCEHPTALLGAIETTFFELPEEVIVTALKSHQRYFTTADPATGALRPWFVAVRDGGREFLDTVTAGNERVLRARLADALFYWRFDQRRTPDQHAQALANVTWLEGYGSVAEQTHRAAALAELLWREGLGDGKPVPDSLRRAASLSRFDLVTEMIKDGKEFTKLEGVIAARYAAIAGETPEVCTALAESLRPRSANGPLPADRVSKVLSAAWRLDTMAGCWLAGFAPTGAKDPYALRRHTLAVVRILVDLGDQVDLREILAVTVDAYAAYTTEAERADAVVQLLDFVRVRLEGWLQDSAGLDPAIVRAVLPVRAHDPADAVAWARALEGFREREDFLLLARGFKRCANILKGETLANDEREAACDRWRAGGRGRDGEDFGALVEPAATALRDAVAASIPDVFGAESRGDYVTVFQRLSGFGSLIDRFFDEVRVNTDDPVLTGRRVAFLREIHALFRRYADFSLVVPEDD